MKKVLAAAVVLWFFAQTGQSQIGLSPVQDYINKTTTLNNILSNKRATDMSQKAMKGKSVGAAKGKTATTATKAAVQPTVFKTSASILPQTLSKGGNNETKFFESLLDLYKQTAAKDGFPANDLAYAAEYFVVNNYHIYNDLMALPYEKDPWAKRGKNMTERLTLINQKKQLMVTLYQERAIYDQFRETLGANPQIAKMTDAQKQEMAEMLAITFGVAYTAYMKGIDDDDDRTAEKGRQLAKQGLEKLLGVSVDQIKISNKGLEL